MNKYIDFFYKAFFKVHYICFLYILLLAIACPYQNIKWAGAISLGIVILIVKKYRTLHAYFNLFWKRIELNSDTFFLKLQIISLIILFIFSYLLRVNLSWDYGQIITSAYEYARYGEIQNLAYYARYGNNQLILLFFFCYFKVMLFLIPSATISMCQAATLPINCLIIEAAIQMTYRTAKICMGPKHAFVSGIICNGVQREHNKKLNHGLPILHKVPPKRDYGRYFCIMAEKGGTSHGGLTEKLSPFFHAKKQEVNAYGR